MITYIHAYVVMIICNFYVGSPDVPCEYAVNQNYSAIKTAYSGY